MRKRILCLLVLLSVLPPAFCGKISGLYRKTLPNGMEVFVAENPSAPLAYIEIAVRAGAVTQTPENAGLFHLYEHLMFKGNAKYPDQTEFTKAMNALGVGDWNGSTGVDRVNYFFTVPSSVVRGGMEFWSHAIRTPKIDEEELEREKGVVLSEINGNFTQPSTVAHYALSRALFAESPWRVDSGGSPEAVKNATVEQMRKIQGEFYVPENAAIFVGGDVKHGEIFRYAKEIFGDWRRSSSAPGFEPPPKSDFSAAPVKIVFADSSYSDAFSTVRYVLRGPDSQTDSGDTYAADVWSNLLDEPNGAFMEAVLEGSDLSVPDSDYTGGGYYTRRASGQVSFFAHMRNDGNPVSRSLEFMEICGDSVPEKMLSPDFPLERKISEAKGRIFDSRIFRNETAEGILSELSFYFAACGPDYFFGYDDSISDVGPEDVRNFLEKYVRGRGGVLMVSVSPATFEKYRGDFEKAGFVQATAENAFWWNQR